MAATQRDQYVGMVTGKTFTGTMLAFYDIPSGDNKGRFEAKTEISFSLGGDDSAFAYSLAGAAVAVAALAF